MREIISKAKNISELLKNEKYKIDYFQREYNWKEKHINDIINDLTCRFLEDYQAGPRLESVQDYSRYFLGPIIISRKNNINYIIDGQQRLTSLTLLLIYLRNLIVKRFGSDDDFDNDLVISRKFRITSFNLQIEERDSCMQALWSREAFDETDKPESVQNLIACYKVIEDNFPEELSGEALLYFYNWLIYNTDLVEITAYSDDDAYAIFETMNDRGLPLTPTEMLKGILLTNIADSSKRDFALTLWKNRIQELNTHGKDVEADCFKTWLRSQYANSIRDRKKNAEPKDFDRIGTEYHRWVFLNLKGEKLSESDDFYRFIDVDFRFYSRQYLRLIDSTQNLIPGLEPVLYNAHQGFTLQFMLLLAPLNPNDADEVVQLKLHLVAKFVDILLTWRIWNFRSITYSTMQYSMFRIMQEIRGLGPHELAEKLHKLLSNEQQTFDTNDRLHLHQQNGRYLHHILARITDYVESQSDKPSRYLEYVNSVSDPKDPYEIEHIWASKPENRNINDFPHPEDFEDYRNRIGGLLLLPESINKKLKDISYERKLPYYSNVNYLSGTLDQHCKCYDHTRFIQFKERSNLPFHPHEHFNKSDLDERGALYRQIAKQIWDPDQLLREVGL
jgi:uncharacterized protein with ParB-like and HNH nuclease domain